MKKSLVLTGMMGAGKSTIGRLLAKKLNIRFIDVDKLIEKKEQKSIKKIFKLNGEQYFRDLEEKVTLQVLRKNEVVIALGGGAFINNVLRKEILKSSISFWLKSDIENLLKRYKNNNNRPLLKESNLEDEVKKIYHSRKKIYNKANYKINCDNVGKGFIVKKIIKLYEK